MRILLDTHIFLWAITDDSRLTNVHRLKYTDEESELYLSVASLWETLIKVGLGRLTLPVQAADYLAKQMEKNRVAVLPIRMTHLAELAKLPPLHRDPFDRMLVAQARAEGMSILSADPGIRGYGVAIL
ncbi:MAG: type II toxin-antitoxin system VapC family toxin [Bryobacteraceae bacterium]